MKIAIGSDHGGYEYKAQIIKYLNSLKHKVVDCGTDSTDSCHYPAYSFKTAEMVQKKEADLGILICRSGEGVSIAANKVKGIRCAIGYNETVARLSREHNDANMIAFGADYFTIVEIEKMINAFLSATFGGEKHSVRVKMITDYEK